MLYICLTHIHFIEIFDIQIEIKYGIDRRRNKSNKMQQLRFLFAMALLYMFRVTISPIIRSTMLYMATGKLTHLGCY